MDKRTWSDLEYWTEQIAKTEEQINEFRTQLYITMKPLTLEEQWKLRELLSRNSANVHFLTATVENIRAERKSLFRKLFDRG